MTGKGEKHSKGRRHIYFAQDGDMLGAGAACCALGAELQNYPGAYTHDEYHFDLDTIEHDP